MIRVFLFFLFVCITYLQSYQIVAACDAGATYYATCGSASQVSVVALDIANGQKISGSGAIANFCKAGLKPSITEATYTDVPMYGYSAGWGGWVIVSQALYTYDCISCPSVASIDAQIATQSATCTAEGGVPHYYNKTDAIGCPIMTGYCDNCATLAEKCNTDCAVLFEDDGDNDGICYGYKIEPKCLVTGSDPTTTNCNCESVGQGYDCSEGPPGSSSSGAGSSGSGSSGSGTSSNSGTSSGNGGSSNSGSSSSDDGAGSSDSGNSSDSGTSSPSGGGGTSSASDDWTTDGECYNSYSEAQAAKYALETSCVAAGRSPAYAIGTGNCISGVCTNTGTSSPSGGGETGTSSGSGGGDGGEGNWATPEDVWEVSHRVDSLRYEMGGYDQNRHADQQATTDAIEDLTNRFAQGTDDVLKTLKEWGDSITGAIRGEGSGLGTCVDQFGNQYQCNTNDPGNGTGVGDWEGYFADGDSNGLGFDSVAGVDSGFYASALGVSGSDSLTSNLGTLQTQIRTSTETPFSDSKALEECPETFKTDFCKWTENFGASPGQYTCVFDICDTRWSIGTATTKKHPFEIMGIILEMSAWLVFFTRIKVS